MTNKNRRKILELEKQILTFNKKSSMDDLSTNIESGLKRFEKVKELTEPTYYNALITKNYKSLIVSHLCL